MAGTLLLVNMIPNSLSGEAEQDSEQEDASTIEATLAAPSKPLFSTHPSEKLAMLIELGQELSQSFNLELLLTLRPKNKQTKTTKPVPKQNAAATGHAGTVHNGAGY